MGPFSNRLSILIYHRVLPQPDALFPDLVSAQEFDRQLALLDRWFQILPLPEAVKRLRSGTLSARSACITFDDGYADNATVALPILRARGLHATFFVSTGFLNGGCMWNDAVIETVRRARADIDADFIDLGILPVASIELRRKAINALIEALKYRAMDERLQCVEELTRRCGCVQPADLMMSDAQVRELHNAGMEIGGHTVNHPILARLETERARYEIVEGKRRLEELIGAAVTLFAYPNGKPRQDYLSEHVALVRQTGFAAAVSTSWGAAGAGSDPYQLPRFTPWDRTPTRFLLRLVQNTFRSQAERV